MLNIEYGGGKSQKSSYRPPRRGDATNTWLQLPAIKALVPLLQFHGLRIGLVVSTNKMAGTGKWLISLLGFFLMVSGAD